MKKFTPKGAFTNKTKLFNSSGEDVFSVTRNDLSNRVYAKGEMKKLEQLDSDERNEYTRNLLLACSFTEVSIPDSKDL